ncbi:DUF6668 family protein [Streptomyces sp. NPDC057199]|uniref:DUF6668 family protein n=1 Tax=Streptomyces sp. NPDC057199 TaxID=3346047 RepID=UPI00362D6F58
MLRPQPGAVPAPTGGLPLSGRPAVGGAFAWVGCHGGAGVTTLQHTVPGGIDGDRVWPGPLPAGGLQPVVLVCRSHAAGLMTAQQAAAQWASGQLPHIDLVGLVVVADAAGRLPRPLRDLLRLVSGGLPRTWHVPWVEPWRQGDPVTDHQPRELTALARELSHLTDRSHPHV